MSEKHTPGDWRISHIIVGRVSSRAEIKSGDTHIASVYAPGSDRSQKGAPTRKQAFANRSLIAAAPDLLAALETARDYVAGELEYRKQGLAGYPDKWRTEEQDLAAIDAALSKARGTS
ncbi:hypothetical protein [Bowmanella yangjiangensis]|uniref:Uncharacterized protein n=1 Tax=Bowmanella yangjiangensis TaxID=2811230 RepID=A0ABS3D0V8_9ALTE|nr:hypothetical protein [Bowmanella yangjiangensis]MBN7822220.1 hypothetical protein [Bowmanella yangjiangensis]